MVWFLIWVVLVLAAAAVFAVLGRWLYVRAKALLAEMSLAAERLAAVSEELDALVERSSEAELAVFSDPTRLRAERYEDRRARRGRHLPGRRPGKPTRPRRANAT